MITLTIPFYFISFHLFNEDDTIQVHESLVELQVCFGGGAIPAKLSAAVCAIHFGRERGRKLRKKEG
jgi:hypothetical protein